MDSDSDIMDELDHSPAEIISEEDKELIEALQLECKGDSGDIDTHLTLIEILRKNKLEDDLETARRHVSDHFGMPESFWTLWLEDESTTLTTDDKILQLDRFLKAMQDHPCSVSLRLKHLDYIQEQVEEAKAPECEIELRSIFTDSMLDTAYLEALDMCKFEFSKVGYKHW